MKQTMRIAVAILGLLIGCYSYGQEETIPRETIVEVKIQGNNKTKTNALTRLISIEIGQPLDSLVIEKDIQILQRLPSVAAANYKVNYSQKGCKVIYEVEENHTLIPSANVYTTNDEEFAFRIGVYEFNLLGQNMTLGGVFQNDIYSSYMVNFRAPYFFTKRLGFAFNHNNITTQEPVFLENGIADYKYNNKSYELLGLYQFNTQNRIELGFNYFNEAYDYKNGV